MELDGYAVAHNLDYLQYLPVERFTNFIWWMLTNGRDKDDVAKIRAQLWQQPKGQVITDARSPWSTAAEGRSFAALKKSMGGGAPSK